MATNGLHDDTFDTATSLSIRLGSLKCPLLKLEPAKVEIKKDKSRAIGEMIADKRTPGAGEIGDLSAEIRASDWAYYILPRLPEQGGTMVEFVVLALFAHPSVNGRLAILHDRCCFTAIEGPPMAADEKTAIVKVTLSCMERRDKGADGKWKKLFSVSGQPSSTARALMKF